MEFIFTAFENHEPDLSFLKDERERIKSAFDSLRSGEENNLQLEIEEDIGIGKLSEQLTKFSNKMTFFHLSSHHDSDYFPLSDGALADDSIVHILNNCQKLKLVFLNGCSTENIINQLENVPIVIGTNKPINDFFAKEVSAKFFELLCQNLGNLSNPEIIKSCFEQSLGHAKNFNNLSEVERGGGKNINVDDRVESYIYLDNKDKVKDYDVRVVYNLDATKYKVNSGLNDIITNWILQHKLKIGVSSFMGLYPFIFSYHLKKLDPTKALLSELDPERFQEIKNLYFKLQILLKYCGYALIWDKMLKGDVDIKEEFRTRLNEELTINWDEIHRCGENHLFLKELYKELSHVVPDSEFVGKGAKLLHGNNEEFEKYADCFSRTIDADDTKQLIQAEEFLYFFIYKCYYLVNYSFISVYNSEFFKYKIAENKYESRLRYFLDDSKPDTSKDEIQFTTNYEVYSVHIKNKKTEDHINLSPFYVDFNTRDNASNQIDMKFLKKYYKETNMLKYQEVGSNTTPTDLELEKIMVQDYYTEQDIDQRIKLHFKALLKSIN